MHTYVIHAVHCDYALAMMEGHAHTVPVKISVDFYLLVATATAVAIAIISETLFKRSVKVLPTNVESLNKIV